MGGREASLHAPPPPPPPPQLKERTRIEIEREGRKREGGKWKRDKQREAGFHLATKFWAKSVINEWVYIACMLNFSGDVFFNSFRLSG